MIRIRRFGFEKFAAPAIGALISLSCNPTLTQMAAPVPPPISMTSASLPDTSQSIDLDAYRAHSAVSRVGGHTRVRLAAAGSCPTPCGTVVTFEAYPNTKDVSAQGVSVPILVGFLTNNGPYTTAMYSLKPADAATYEVWAMPNTTTPTVTDFQIFEIPSAHFGRVAARSQGQYHSCHHKAAEKSEADFRPCELPMARAFDDAILTIAMRDDWIGLVARAIDKTGMAGKRVVAEDNGWLSCDGGCCTLVQ